MLQGSNPSSVSKGGTKVHACRQLEGFESIFRLCYHSCTTLVVREDERGSAGRGPADALSTGTSLSFQASTTKYNDRLSRENFIVS